MLQPKKEKFQIKNSDIFHVYFSYSSSKHRLWVLVRTASSEYPQSMILAKEEKNAYPCKPQFFIYKSGVKGGQNYIGKFS